MNRRIKKIVHFIIVVFFIVQLTNCPVSEEKKENEKKAALEFPNKRLGGISNDIGRTIITDHNGNIIVAGEITLNADLNGDGDKIDGIELLDSIYYGGYDIFISKFNSSGVFLWAKRLGGTQDDSCTQIAIDSDNNIILTGKITNFADLNGDQIIAGTDEIYGSTDNEDIFIVKFDPSGVFQWSKRLGRGTGSDCGYSIITDGNNDIIVTGAVTDDVDLDGDPANIVTGETGGYGGKDVFISKFHSNGDYIWSKRLGGAATDIANGIACDQSGNIIVTGNIIGSADLNGDGDSTDGAVESSPFGNSDIFISKFEFDGDFLWAKRKGGSSGDAANSVDIDSDGNIYITGHITDSADLNNDGFISINSAESAGGVFGDNDACIIKMNSAGEYAGSKRIGGIQKDNGLSLIIDNNDNVIAGISGKQEIYCKGTELSPLLISSPGVIHAGYDGLIIKFTKSLSYIRSYRLGGLDNDYSVDITADNIRNIFVTGYVIGNADLNGDNDTSDGLAESGSGLANADIFISKFSE